MKGNYTLPKFVTVIDGTLREGIQNEEIFIPTETKLFKAVFNLKNFSKVIPVVLYILKNQLKEEIYGLQTDGTGRIA